VTEIATETDSATTATNSETENASATETEQLNPADASISFAGSRAVGKGLLPFLLEAYGSSIDATTDITMGSDTETLVRYAGTDDTDQSSVYVSATRSGDATEALAKKEIVFGMTSRQINDDEVNRLTAAGLSDPRNSNYENTVAVDGIAIVTHPSNPLRELSMVDLSAIYRGQIDNWSQLGGADTPITVLAPEQGSDARRVFERVVFEGEDAGLAQQVSYTGEQSAAMAAAVEKDPLAIGYLGFAFSEGLNRLDLTNECGDVYSATTFALKSEEYPLGRRLYFYNRADNTNTEAQRFLEFVLSPRADSAITSSGFVNLAVERVPLDPSRYEALYEGRNVQSMAQLEDDLKEDLKFWDRFSTTVRFQPDSFMLGNKELGDIKRLVSALSDLPQGTQIAAVGITDDVAANDDNLRMSRLRTQTVADAINSLANDNGFKVKIDTRYFSKMSPSFCEINANGRATNQRVEIWIRN